MAAQSHRRRDFPETRVRGQPDCTTVRVMCARHFASLCVWPERSAAASVARATRAMTALVSSASERTRVSSRAAPREASMPAGTQLIALAPSALGPGSPSGRASLVFHSPGTRLASRHPRVPAQRRPTRIGPPPPASAEPGQAAELRCALCAASRSRSASLHRPGHETPCSSAHPRLPASALARHLHLAPSSRARRPGFQHRCRRAESPGSDRARPRRG